MTTPPAPDVQSTWCATLVDEWCRLGLTTAVVAPGSRSTPMALALAARDDLDVQVAHDERTAAFIALGVGLASGRPAALLCTSGTAATHFHGAVVEAHLAGVPMLVLTADRPPELHGIGAPQTIDQQHLYGSAAQFVDPGVAEWDGRDGWRAVASDVWSLDGPVHVNLPFREPLVGTPLDLPGAVDASGASSGAADVDLSGWVELLDHQRGVVVAGRGVDDPSAVDVFATSLGWPVLADPRSGCRGGAASVVAFDSLMRNASFAAAHTPTVVLHLGEPPASKVLGQWLQASGATHLQVLPRPAVIDPLQIMQTTVVASVADVCARLAGSVRGSADTPWLARWRHADAAAQRAIVDVLARNGVSEPGVCRALTEREGALVVSSSMPIRDVEWFGAPEQHADLWSNRGANGIDGVIATGIGVALTRPDRRATVLLGDVAFCHDSSSLTALRHRDVSVSVVVLDNDGGGIFSFLPQASLVTPRRFEQLFGTPHGTDVAAVGAAHGLAVCDVTSLADLHAALDRPGSAVIRVRTTRDANVALHARLHDAVSAAL